VKRTIEHQGKKVTGTHVPFETMREEWNEYSLADGTTLKVKIVLQDVLRLDGEYNQVTGDPIYVINSSNHVVSTTVRDDLRKGSND